MQAKQLWKVPGYVVLAGVLTIGSALAGPTSQSNRVQVADASGPAPAGAKEAVVFPADQAGVRAAAAHGPEALRWYIQRTRMIHNFYYYDFAKEVAEIG
jgi:hypothetical protein